MSAPVAKENQETVELKTIRLTITSRNVKDVEKTCENIIKAATEQTVNFRGPVRLPTKHLRISTRKTPNGEGSKTWDSYEMNIHKRVIDIHATQEVLVNITRFEYLPSVTIGVKFIA